MADTWLADISKAISSRFQDEVIDGNYPSNLTVIYDNDPTQPPTAETALLAGDVSAWCRVSIRPANTEQITIGAPSTNRFRHTGVMICQCFCPIHEGDATVLKVADVIAKAFRAATEDGVRYRTPRIEVIGRVDKWWQVNVTCPWQSNKE